MSLPFGVEALFHMSTYATNSGIIALLMVGDREQDNTNVPETWQPPTGIIPEPITGREAEYTPGEPTPANESLPEVRDHQREVNALAFHIIDDLLPSHITPKLALFIERVYLNREAVRSTKNSRSFKRRITEPEAIHDQIVHDVLYKMQIGTSKPYETFAGMIAQGNAAAEVGKLMHIAGYRMEYLNPMREEVFDGIRIHDGEIIDNPEENYEIMTYDNADTTRQNIDYAIAMTRKKLIGTVGDIRVYERSSFILRTDIGSHLDPSVAERLRRIQITDMTKNEHHNTEIWKTLIVSDVRFQKEVKRLLALDDYETIIPLSTTIYGHNPVLDAEIVERENNNREPGTPPTKEMIAARKLGLGVARILNKELTDEDAEELMRQRDFLS